MNRKTTIAVTAALASVTLTGCDDPSNPSHGNPFHGLNIDCDGPNRVYRLLNDKAVAVVKDDPRCTDSKG